ncbi:hypothetical protein TSAR_015081, partial [Trichomalopsis sarcophagae]
TTLTISIKFDIHIYFWILNSGKIRYYYFAFFLNHPIVTNNSAIMHLKENKITYFSSFGARD